jgi:hypothetical protein
VDDVTKYLIGETKGESIVFSVQDILNKLSSELNLNDKDTGLYRIKQVKNLVDARHKLKMLELMQDKVRRDIERSVA